MKTKLILGLILFWGFNVLALSLTYAKEEQNNTALKITSLSKKEIKKRLLKGSVYLPSEEKERTKVKKVISSLRKEDKKTVLQAYLNMAEHHLKEANTNVRLKRRERLKETAFSAASLVYDCAGDYPELLNRAQEIKQATVKET